MSNAVLKKFRTSENWRAGVDAKVTDDQCRRRWFLKHAETQQPVVGFVFGQKGLMAGATLEGSKFTKMKSKQQWKQAIEEGYPARQDEFTAVPGAVPSVKSQKGLWLLVVSPF